ncbi:MAG: hypothetical protein AB1611_10440 [bacterium]
MPGSKATLADARHLAEQGWFSRLKSACDRGVALIGLSFLSLSPYAAMKSTWAGPKYRAGSNLCLMHLMLRWE